MTACPFCGGELPAGAQRCKACGGQVGTNPGRLQPGTQLQSGRYSIGKTLGQGGFGITYLGADRQAGAPVAIKELFPEGAFRTGTQVCPPLTLRPDAFAEARRRVLDEANTLRRFQHPGIVRVLEAFEENDTAYLVMELLRGETLQARLERVQKLPAQLVMDLAAALGSALAELHSRGVLHRDIKPDNVILTDDGRVVLVDFGSARAFVKGHTVQLTATVTPGYAPLEQYAHQGRFGPYTDLYGLGATLFHALMGAAPPPSPDRHLGVPLPALPAGTPDALRRALEKAMALRVEDRPQAVSEFLAILGKGGAPAPAERPVQLSLQPESGTAPDRYQLAVTPERAASSRALVISKRTGDGSVPADLTTTAPWLAVVDADTQAPVKRLAANELPRRVRLKVLSDKVPAGTGDLEAKAVLSWQTALGRQALEVAVSLARSPAAPDQARVLQAAYLVGAAVALVQVMELRYLLPALVQVSANILLAPVVLRRAYSYVVAAACALIVRGRIRPAGIGLLVLAVFALVLSVQQALDFGWWQFWFWVPPWPLGMLLVRLLLKTPLGRQRHVSWLAAAVVAGTVWAWPSFW